MTLYASMLTARPKHSHDQSLHIRIRILMKTKITNLQLDIHVTVYTEAPC